jgi:predicted Zn-ribbon and HTH transcriptional regulator
MKKLVILRCLHCRHVWPSRLGRKPKVCPKCKSYNWNKLPKIKHRRVQKK